MKVKVTKEYIDRHAGEFHAIGEIVTMTEKRFAEIVKAGPYVEKIEQAEPVETPKKIRKNRE